MKCNSFRIFEKHKSKILKMRNIFLLFLVTLFYPIAGQNTLFIPDTLSGNTFNLTIQNGTVNFYGTATNTMGINGNILAPTLILHKGDSVNLAVNNQIMDTTTIHWHGLHVAAMNDGGPHTTIPPGTVWTPGFQVRDQASTYWYHPHLHMHTNEHVINGIAGMIIVRDSNEASLALPRTYGVDDIPMVIQTKAFNANKQFLYTSALDTAVMVNATIDPIVNLPAQVVRLRLLNGASERVLEIGFTNNQTFYMIGSDGGLLNSPVNLTRLRLAPGERAEILLNLSGQSGNLSMFSFASELPNATYGAAQPGMGPGQTIPNYSLNPLNGNNFEIIKINIVSATANAITTIPSSLITNTPIQGAVNTTRTLTFSPMNMGPTAIQGPFLINNSSFDMNVINYSIPLDNIETWTLTNNSPIAHPFHIHDVQFYIQSYAGGNPPAHLAGRKDVVLVPAMQSVTFKAKFETFCDDMMPYMYHCHMLPHEDDGMMGQFVVACPTVGVNSNENENFKIYPNPSSETIYIETKDSQNFEAYSIQDLSGKEIRKGKLNASKTLIEVKEIEKGIYFLKIITHSSNAIIRKISID